MAIQQIYVDYGAGNDYKGASFTDGAFTVADMTLTKAGAFAASKVNHWLYLDDNGSGEVTPGYYKIASKTSDNAVVLAASPKSGANDPTDVVCTQAAGTALLPWRSIQGAMDLATSDNTDGDQINVVAGTAQVLSAAWDWTTFGNPTLTAPCTIRGCTATANDGGVAEINCGGFQPLGTLGRAYLNLVDLELHTFGNQDGLAISTGLYLNLTIHKGGSTPSARALCNNVTPGGRISHCHIYNPGTTGRCVTLGDGLEVDHCTLDTGSESGAYGIYLSGSGLVNATVQNCLILVGATNGIGVYCNAPGPVLRHNTVRNSTAGTTYGIGLDANNAGRPALICTNNLVAGWSGAGGIGIKSVGDVYLLGHNAYYNNTTNLSVADQVFIDLTANDVVLGSDPFTNAAGGDYSVGTDLQAQGWPTALPGVSTNTYIDIGAAQRQEAGGGEAHLDSEVLDTATTPGTYHAPDAAEVISTAVFGVNSGTSGTVVLPAVGDVKDGVTYGPSSGLTGTYDPMAAAVFPAEANTLEAESAYGPTGAEYAGTYHSPDAAEVIDTAVFGPSSATAGTYDTTADPATPAEIAAVVAPAVWALARAGNDGAGTFGAVSEWASTGGLDAAGVRAAVGLASANLDTQLLPLASLADDTDIATAVRTELATELARITGPVALEATLTAIKGAGWTTQTLVAIVAAIGSGGITAQQVRDALKLAPTAGAAADGSIDDLLTDMPAAVEAALSGYQVIVQSAVSTDGQITVYQGYDYAAADDRAIEFEVATPDFTGATTALKFDGDTYAGAVVNPGLTTQLLRFEFTAVQTAAMTAGYHAYRLEVTRAGRLLLEETGVINVKE